jgi:triosephosphate isomerase (TIM)
MNLNRIEAQSLASEISGMLRDEVRAQIKVVLFPPFPYLLTVGQLIASDSRIAVGAQNCSDHDSGAFTGEVSAGMLASCNVRYVLAGHSERRILYKESDEVVISKVKRILEAGMIPVYCCGETLEERDSGRHLQRIESQIKKLTASVNSGFDKCVIAYEPVWAIGTGRTATPEQAGEMHVFIRELLIGDKGESGRQTTLLYGGSCNDQNAADLFKTPEVDGGLIGGASLKSRSFVNIIKALS